MVTVLTAFPIKRRKLARRLIRGGYECAATATELRVWQKDGHGAVTVLLPAARTVTDLPDSVAESATQLLGLAPRHGIACGFDGVMGQSPEWLTVIDIACAVAADTPLAVLDDHAGTVYLIHPGRGLIGPEEYRRLRSRPSTGDVLRGLLGDRR
jgi:hypothetical protein